MKKLLLSWLLSVAFLSITYAQYDDAYYEPVRTGYQGDYFSLEGALDLFKQSYSLRDFERKLNTEEYWVNNLDLNYDGRIDYIRVEHRRQGNYHAIILQALLDRYDVQDVAVIGIDVIGRREAVLQIIGDEDLYGENVIVEPVEGYSSNRSGYHSNYGSFVNVYYWDPVQYILDQQYHVYVSPYRWHYYPTWWSPWRQCSWSVFRPRIVIYHKHYHVVHRHRVVHVHHFYQTHRRYSPTVVVHANKVRVKHGKAPIHRPDPKVKQEPRYGERPKDARVVEQPRRSTGSRTASPNPSVSRERNVPTSRPEATRSTTTRTDQRSRSSVTSPSRSRATTPTPRPSTRSRTTTSPSDQKANRNTTSRAREQSRSTSKQPRTTTRSGSSRERSSVNSRTAPSTRSRSKSSAPSRVQQPSRSQSTRSSATTRSRTTTSRPSVSSRRSAPTSKPSATRSKTTNSSRSKSGSKGRGN